MGLIHTVERASSSAQKTTSELTVGVDSLIANILNLGKIAACNSTSETSSSSARPVMGKLF